MATPMRDLSEAEAARIRGLVEALPHNARLGIRFDRIEPGRCSARVEYRPELVGNVAMGVLHGGVVTTLIDATCGTAVYAALEPGTPLATLDLRIDYLKPAEPRGCLHASAEVYKLTRQIAFVRAHAHQGDPANQVAHCVASFMTGGIGFSV